MSEEDILESGNDCIGSIDMALSEIDGISEYSEARNLLEEAKSMIDTAKKSFEEILIRKEQEEQDELNRDYERSKGVY